MEEGSLLKENLLDCCRIENCPTERLVPAEVQVYGGDTCLVIGKVLEEFALMQAKYKILINHSPLLGNDNSSKPVPGYDPGHTLGTGDQEPHSLRILKLDDLIYERLTSFSFSMIFINTWSLISMSDELGRHGDVLCLVVW
ncbi:hypothetical protein DSO57_1010269 [Entomophthora muscae]|uniref:Uncharacterized protein n=1 Tax=Entomophthora muscae TaxID=34485 RepID=A0ACC2SJN7_9FUNG|nr:hypothetical protein DSO57_1010269 [Entomophthora muscae]